MKTCIGHSPFILIIIIGMAEKCIGALSTAAGSFTMTNDKLGKCVKAVPPRKMRVEACETSTRNALFRWRWTKDGQIQNIATGLCVDVDGVSQDGDLRLSVCNYRKSFQKWRCQIRPQNPFKLFYVNPAHTRKQLRWRFYIDGEAKLSASTHFWEYNLVSATFANMCDLNHRDVCLQTIGKIPITDTCIVSLATKGHQGYVEVPISAHSPLKEFTISVWIKAPKQTVAGIFSYTVKSNMLLGLVAKPDKEHSDLIIFGKKIKLPAPPLSLFSGFWTHLTLTWSVISGRVVYYVNGDKFLAQSNIRGDPFPGTGTLRIGRVTRGDDMWFSGFLSQFNIFSRAYTAEEVVVLSRKLHCCTRLPIGDWLPWKTVNESGKLFGDSRRNAGAECTSFEVLPKTWQADKLANWTCGSSLFVSDPNYIPDYHFTATSWTGTGVPWNGRASKKSPSPWCPDQKDRHSYLQVHLGSVKNVTAVGTGMLARFKKRYAHNIKLHFSEDGIHWKTDGMVYEGSKDVNPPVKVIPLSSPVLARYLRFYPTSCKPPSCCLSVEVFGCDPELDKRIAESEDGCTRKDKPYILMDLGHLHHVRQIQIKAQCQNRRKPLRSFILYYLSWSRWVPYQVEGQTKVFKGTTETARSFTHILEIPILARFIKIFTVPYAEPACGHFVFIGCLSPHEDVCDRANVHQYRDCAKVVVPQCKLGFIGNGHVCQDIDECELNRDSYCDRNSRCINQVGLYTCKPCKNQFIGDGRICQTSCEALGIVCGENAFCDFDECRCRDGYVTNGTDCVDEAEMDENARGSLDESADVEQSIGGRRNMWKNLSGAA